MEYYNRIRIEFEDAESASASRNNVMTCLDSIDAKLYGYSEKVCFGDIFKEGITYDGEKTFFIYEDARCGFATPEDALELVPEMAKNIAAETRNIPFHISNSNTGTYTDSKIEIQYCENKLVIETIYYPERDYENALCCPECGEEIVSLKDFEAGKTYTCPECGEECELDDEYEDALPIEEKKIIEI